MSTTNSLSDKLTDIWLKAVTLIFTLTLIGVLMITLGGSSLLKMMQVITD